MYAAHLLEMILDMRSMKRYSSIGTKARGREESERPAKTEAHHGHLAIAPRMLLQIRDHAREVCHALLEVVPVVASKGALLPVHRPLNGTRVVVAPEHVGCGHDEAFGGELVSVMRHIAVNTRDGRHDDNTRALTHRRTNYVGIERAADGFMTI